MDPKLQTCLGNLVRPYLKIKIKRSGMQLRDLQKISAFNTNYHIKDEKKIEILIEHLVLSLQNLVCFFTLIAHYNLHQFQVLDCHIQLLFSNGQSNSRLVRIIKEYSKLLFMTCDWVPNIDLKNFSASFTLPYASFFQHQEVKLQ